MPAPAAARPRMVGRALECAELTAALDDARQGRGRTVLLLGEPGMGKSTLVDWLVQRAQAARTGLARGACSAAGTPPLWPWRRALDAVAPALTGPGDGPGPPSTAGLEVLAAAVVETIAAAARRRPLLVVLEDLHWADPASLAVLRAVVDAVPALPVVLLLTCRDDPPESPLIRDQLGELPTSVRRIPLSPLGVDDIAELAGAVVGTPLSRQEVHDLRVRTGGNPFFVHEVARLQAAHGPASRLVVPPGVQEVLRRRTARLGQACAGLLRAAAVTAETAADVIELDLLSAVVGSDEITATRLLDEAVSARLLDADRARPTQYRFRHALVREVLAHDLSTDLRGRLHAQVAQALEEHRDGQVTASRLAHHWCRATGDGARERAAAWSVRAAREAVTAFGFEEAVAHFARALPEPSIDRVAVSIEYGEALQLAGDLTAAREVLLGAAHTAAARRRPVELARAALALGGGLAGFEVPAFDDEQTELLEQARTALPDAEDGLRAAVHGRLSLALAGRVPDAERVRLATDGVAGARRAGEPEIECAALAAYCDALAGPDHVVDRLAAASRMLELGRDVSGVLLAHRLLLLARLEQGELAAAEAQALAYERVAHRVRVARYRWLPEIWRGMRALLDGDPDRALRHADTAEEIGLAAGSGNARLMAFTVRLQAHLDRGTPERFAGDIHAVLDAIGPTGMPPMYYAAPARALLAAGEEGYARTVLRAFLAGTPATMPRDAEWLEAHWAMADIALQLDDRAAVAGLFAALLPYRDLWAVDGLGAVVFGVVAEQLGRLAARLGRADAAGLVDAAREHYLRQGLTALVSRLDAGRADAVPDGPVPAEPLHGRLHHDGRVWVLEWRERRSTVPDSKGVRDLAVLLARPGRAVPVLDLVAATDGPRTAAAAADLGPLLDDTARHAYRSRLAELDAEIDDAESGADLHRLERLRSERAALIDQLAGAVGLGGRARIAGDPVERARKAVTMRIRAAITAIGREDDALARHLRNTVRTGRVCSYEPESPVTWRS